MRGGMRHWKKRLPVLLRTMRAAIDARRTFRQARAFIFRRCKT
jgi:hypothetical protein